MNKAVIRHLGEKRRALIKSIRCGTARGTEGPGRRGPGLGLLGAAKPQRCPLLPQRAQPATFQRKVKVCRALLRGKTRVEMQVPWEVPTASKGKGGDGQGERNRRESHSAGFPG